jgi:hypothetical protein
MAHKNIKKKSFISIEDKPINHVSCVYENSTDIFIKNITPIINDLDLSISSKMFMISSQIYKHIIHTTSLQVDSIILENDCIVVKIIKISDLTSVTESDYATILSDIGLLHIFGTIIIKYEFINSTDNKLSPNGLNRQEIYIKE